jgi:hypothetical protein
MKENETIIVYMDLIAMKYEIGYASDGNKVYPSIEDLKRQTSCWPSCGIAEVEITFKRIVEPQNLKES